MAIIGLLHSCCELVGEVQACCDCGADRSGHCSVSAGLIVLLGSSGNRQSVATWRSRREDGFQAHIPFSLVSCVTVVLGVASRERLRETLTHFPK